jgi:hypothetical protein
MRGKTWVGWLVSLAAAVAIALPAVAEEQEGETLETGAFKITVPTGWDLKEVKVDPDGKTGAWVITGPTRNSKVWVRVKPTRPGAIKEVWNEFVGQFLSKRVKGIKVQSFEEKTEGDTEAALGFIYGVSRHIEKGLLYKFGVLVGRNQKQGRIVYMASGGTEETWGKQAMRFGRILRSFNLK